MKTSSVVGAGILLSIVACFAAAQDPTGTQTAAPGRDRRVQRESRDQDAIRRAQKVLTETQVDTTDLPDEISLAKLLKALEKKLPPGSTLTLGIDEPVFGKQLRKVADTPFRCAHLKRCTLQTALHRFLGQVGTLTPVDYVICPTGVLVTTARRAAYRLEYAIGDLVKQAPVLLPQVKHLSPALERDSGPADGVEMLAQILNEEVRLQPWESFEVLDGSRLVVTASHRQQEMVASLLAALHRVLEVSVVLNARIYEVDRAFYARQVAPLFAKEDEEKGRAVVSIDGLLFKKIAGKKLIHESEPSLLRQNKTATFLSRQKVFRYDSRKGSRAGLCGLSFSALPVVSSDRRFLTLKITQRVARLQAIEKWKILDRATGKEVEVEAPNIGKAARTSSLIIADGAAILMPVICLPEGGGDRVWLLLARPFIWIESEVRERGDRGAGLPQEIWDSAVPDEEPEPATTAATDRSERWAREGTVAPAYTGTPISIWPRTGLAVSLSRRY